MNITNDCVKCIVGQIDKACKLLNLDETLANEINSEVKRRSLKFSFEKTPPFVAKDVYEYLGKKTNLKDPLKALKEISIEKAKGYLPFLEEKIVNSQDKLFASIKASVAGNVIDFATTLEFSLEDEINNIFHTDFEINNYLQFKEKLENSDSLIILADNAGENIFDKLLVKTISKIYPNIKIYYATRGKPIINDITTKEAYESGIDEFCEIISSGVDTPGFEKSQSSKKFLNLFEKAPLILSKGMGNFECLESYNDNRIFFLFKVKCNVVANSINKEIGTIVLKRG